MKFFSNKISVNGPSRSFNDIIRDVTGGMSKQASAVDAPEVLEKEAKKELPAFIKDKINERKKKPKEAESDGFSKIADVIKVNDDEVLLVLANSSDDETDVDIEDDHADEEITEAMGAVAAAGCGYGTKESDSSCASDSGGEEEEIGNAYRPHSNPPRRPKTSSEHPKFVKIANLTDKQKGKFRSYWSNVWPKEFINAILDTEN